MSSWQECFKYIETGAHQKHSLCQVSVDKQTGGILSNSETRTALLSSDETS